MSARRFLDAHGEVLRTVMASPHGGAAGAKRIVTAVASLPRGPRAQRFCRLFAEYRADGQGAPALWMTTLVHRPMDELIELAGAHAWTPGALRRMEGRFGLQDFEGRSFPGWHRNVTLVSAACAYSRLAEPEPAPTASAAPKAAWPPPRRRFARVPCPRRIRGREGRRRTSPPAPKSQPAVTRRSSPRRPEWRRR